MDARVVREFGVEGGGHDASLADGDGRIIFALGRDDFDALAEALDLGGADEDHFDRRRGGLPFPCFLFQELAFADGAIDLASVGIAADADIDGAQPALLRILNFSSEQDRPRARAEGGLVADELLELQESFFAQELEKRARFASGDDQAVDGVQLFRLLDEHNFGAQLLEPFAMGVEISLEGEDADFGSIWHLAVNSRCGSVATESGSTPAFAYWSTQDASS